MGGRSWKIRIRYGERERGEGGGGRRGGGINKLRKLNEYNSTKQ